MLDEGVVILDIFEEVVALRKALDIGFISIKEIKQTLKKFYEEGKNNNGILYLTLENNFLTDPQIEFISEGIEEDKQENRLPKKFDITKYNEVQNFLGLTNNDSDNNRFKNTARIVRATDKVQIIECPHCNAKYKLSLKTKASKFQCVKCKKNFYTTPVDNKKTLSVTKKGPVNKLCGQTISLSKDKLDELRKNLDNSDELKLPEIDNASTVLNIATNMDSNKRESAFSTMELNIKNTSLFDPKVYDESKEKEKIELTDEQKEALEELKKHSNDLSQQEAAIIVRNALDKDFISIQEVNLILNEYYETLLFNEENTNLVSILVSREYITPLQLDNLKKKIKKDKVAHQKINKVKMANRTHLESFIGKFETKKLLRITCPHCKIKFVARVSSRGGKFRCGKCKKTFFLTK